MNRSTILLIALLLVLGAIVLFLLPSDQEREVSDRAPDVALHIDSAAVVKLEIQHAPKLMLLENIGGKWMITAPARYPADPSAVTHLIGGLSRFKVGSLISSNPQKQGIFQVDTGGTHIVVTERSGKTTNLVIGKMGPSFSEVYFRLPSSDNVYLGEGIDSWSVNKDLKEWRDKTIFSQPAEAIQSLAVTANGKEHDFERDSTSWKSGDQTVETSVLNPVLNTLANLRADDFIDTATSFQTHPITVSIRGVENVSLNLYPVPPDSSKFIVQTSASPQLYTIGKYTAQQLLKPIGVVVGGGTSPVASAPHTVSGSSPSAAMKKKPEPETSVIPKKESAPPPVVETAPPKRTVTRRVTKPVTKQETSTVPPAPKKTSESVEEQTTPRVTPKKTSEKSAATGDDEGDLTVHTVKRGETMESIARSYGVSVEQILKWNLLKSIVVKPGQELYVYVKK